MKKSKYILPPQSYCAVHAIYTQLPRNLRFGQRIKSTVKQCVCFVYMYAYVCICMYMYVYICMYMYVYVCKCMYMYVQYTVCVQECDKLISLVMLRT